VSASRSGRRLFLRRMAGAVAAGAATFGGVQWWTRQRRPGPTPLPPTAVRLGPVERFAEGATLVAEHRILVVRHGPDVTALSAICSHQGCTVVPSRDRTRIECPCHATVYDTTGKVISGDAPVRLRRYRAFVAADTGELVVDRRL
jgi:Rieske Fe-S protein